MSMEIKQQNGFKFVRGPNVCTNIELASYCTSFASTSHESLKLDRQLFPAIKPLLKLY